MAKLTQHPAVFFKSFQDCCCFAFPVLNPNYHLIKPQEFHFVKLCVFSCTALVRSVHAGYECLWIVFGLITKGHKSFECRCAQLQPFGPFAHSNKSLLSFCFTHTHARTLSITPLASLPWCVREIYGEKLGSSSVVFPRGVSQPHLYAMDSLPVELQDWHIQNFVYPSRIGRASAIKQNEIFRVKLVVISLIFISQLLMKMYWSCETWTHRRLEREQGKISLHTVALSYSRLYCFVMRASVWSHYASRRRQMFFGSSHFLALFVSFLNHSEIPRLSQKPGVLLMQSRECVLSFETLSDRCAWGSR